jgi:hypothetical protein
LSEPISAAKSSTQQIRLLIKNGLRDAMPSQNPVNPTWQSSTELMLITLIGDNIKRLLLSVACLAVAASGPLWEDAASRPVRIGVWSGLLLVCVATLAAGVIQKRKEGKSWNEALAAGSKLVTGSVWLDGAIFAAIMVAICVAVFGLFYWM